MITYAGPQIAYIITGSMIVETIFTIGGIGSKFVSAITNRDYTMIMATTIFLATLMVAATLICDLLYKLVDPASITIKERRPILLEQNNSSLPKKEPAEHADRP